jgi:putative nucleotidyltransferase with HDIG domain
VATTPEEFIEQLLVNIEGQTLKLPILPDVALKVHMLMDNPKASVSDIARALSMDAAISARIIQVANSPMFRGRSPIEDLNTAILRMGHSLVRSLVTVMLVEQAHHPKSPFLRERISRLWKHNTQVAALSYIIARNYTTMKPDEAMLAGLLHDIGVLPVLEHALHYPEILQDSETLDSIIQKTHTIVGRKILESWKFPQHFIDVVAYHEDLTRDSGVMPELVDVVIVANMHSTITIGGRRPNLPWGEIPAFKTLGLTPEESIQTLKDAADEIRNILAFFRS